MNVPMCSELLKSTEQIGHFDGADQSYRQTRVTALDTRRTVTNKLPFVFHCRSRRRASKAEKLLESITICNLVRYQIAAKYINSTNVTTFPKMVVELLLYMLSLVREDIR